MAGAVRRILSSLCKQGAVTTILAGVVLGAVACGPHAARIEPTHTSLLMNAAPEPAGPYRIQVGDRLHVRFYRNEELDQEVVVRPDGMISLPYVDEVRAAGLTPAELDADLTRRYTGELASPEVTVIVTEYGGQIVYVAGEVGHQGIVELRGGMSLFQAIQAAGGFTDRAHRAQVVLIRRGPDGKAEGREIDTRKIADGSSPSSDVLLNPYDVVYVPKSKIANVDVFVDQYIRQLLPINPGVAIGAAAGSGTL